MKRIVDRPGFVLAALLVINAALWVFVVLVVVGVCLLIKAVSEL